MSQDIGIVVLTVVIVDLLWNVLGGEPISKALKMLGDTLSEIRSSVKLLEDSKRNGLERVFSVSGALGSHAHWMNRLKSARSNIDLMGYSLHVWTRGENFEDEIVKSVHAGVNVRILIMDDNNDDMEALLNIEQIKSISVAAVKEELRVTRNAFSSISDRLASSDVAGTFEFRTLKNGLIVCQLCRTDSELTMVQYLFSEVASRSPLLVIRGQDTQLFEIYMREFERLWELGEPC